MICFKTWGVNIGNLSVNMHWRDMFINRPHVVFNGKKKNYWRNKIYFKINDKMNSNC